MNTFYSIVEYVLLSTYITISRLSSTGLNNVLQRKVAATITYDSCDV